MEMGQRPFPVTGTGQFGIVRQAVLNRPTDDLFGLDQAVRLRDDPAIDRTGFMVGGCAVVFRSNGNRFNLIPRKPAFQLLHFQYHPSALQMVRLPVDREAEIVAGCRRIQQIPVDRIESGEGQGTRNDGAGMILPMRLVKGRIARNDGRLEKYGKGRIDSQQFSREQRQQSLIGRQPADAMQFLIRQPAGCFMFIQVQRFALEGA